MPGLSLVRDTPNPLHRSEKVGSDRHPNAGRLLIDKLALAAGEHVLDISCGTKFFASHAADILGPSGSIVAIGPQPPQADLAKLRTKSNFTYREGDAYDLVEFAEATFDVVCMNTAFHGLPEDVGPLLQIHRVLRRGGRMGIATGPGEHLGTLQAIRKRVLACEPYVGYPVARAGTAHRVTVKELQDLLLHIGFLVTSIMLVPNVSFHPTPCAALEYSQASSFGNFLGHLPDELRCSATNEILRALEASRTPDGIRLECARLIAVAHKLRD
jgi:ubiquinone/menaquinone biosynthesis C-methylase UbiE